MTIPIPGDGETVKSRFVLWLLCGVGLGILPVLANLISPVFTNTHFSISRPLADGELLLSSTAIAGAAIGELFQVNINSAKARILANLCGGFTILFCALCAIAYALTKASVYIDQSRPEVASSPVVGPFSPGNQLSGVSGTINSQNLTGPALASVALFMLTIATAGVCIRLAAEAREIP